MSTHAPHMTRKRAKDHLKKVIDAWKACNEHDQLADGVCHGLLESEAPLAFAVIPPERWITFLRDCIEAKRVQQRHPQVVRDAADGLAAANKAAALIEDCADIILPRIVSSGPGPVEEAIDLLRWQAASMRQMAQRCIDEHSRRSDPAPAQSAAVGWIKESMLRLSGGDNREHVRVVAEAALESSITMDTVRNAVCPSDALRHGYTLAKELDKRRCSRCNRFFFVRKEDSAVLCQSCEVETLDHSASKREP